MKIPKLCSFVKPEIDYFIENCNFTDDELEYFKLKVRDKSNVYIAQQMNVSENTVVNIGRKVKKKIIKVL